MEDQSFYFLGIYFDAMHHLVYGLIYLINAILATVGVYLFRHDKRKFPFKFVVPIFNFTTTGIVTILAIYRTQWAAIKSGAFTPACVWFNGSMALYFMVMFLAVLIFHLQNKEPGTVPTTKIGGSHA